MRLACAMIYVKDFLRMKEFYQRILGVQPVNTEWMDSWALFEAGGARLAAPCDPSGISRRTFKSLPRRKRETSPVKLIFEVEDVGAERNRFEAMGITMLQRPWQNAAEECEGIDPEGNIF